MRTMSTPNPYWYAHIVGISYTDVYHVGEKSKTDKPYRMNFLWAHWFGLDGSHHSRWKAQQLHQIGFFNSEEECAFIFLFPNEIIWAVHLILASTHGLIHNLPSDSLAHHPKNSTHEKLYYYIIMWICMSFPCVLLLSRKTYFFQVCWLWYVHVISRW